MSDHATIDEARAKLKELIQPLAPGEELVITENQLPIAKLIGSSILATTPSRPSLGLCRAAITYMAPGFDAPLEEMKEYME